MTAPTPPPPPSAGSNRWRDLAGPPAATRWTAGRRLRSGRRAPPARLRARRPAVLRPVVRRRAARARAPVRDLGRGPVRRGWLRRLDPPPALRTQRRTGWPV